VNINLRLMDKIEKNYHNYDNIELSFDENSNENSQWQQNSANYFELFELHYFLNFPELETKSFELHIYASHQQLDVWVKVKPTQVKCYSIKRQTPSNDERARILGPEWNYTRSSQTQRQKSLFRNASCKIIF